MRQNKRHFQASEMPSLGPEDAFFKPNKRHLFSVEPFFLHFSAVLKTFSGLLNRFSYVLFSSPHPFLPLTLSSPLAIFSPLGGARGGLEGAFRAQAGAFGPC